MSFCHRSLISLEFDKIREMLALHATTEGAKSMAMTLSPSDDIDNVLKRLKKTTDAKRLCENKGTPSFSGVRDISEACDRAGKGASLNTRELLDVALVLKTARGLIDYCYGNHLFDTVLDEIFDRLIPNRSLEDKIYRSIISEELIADISRSCQYTQTNTKYQ